MQTIYADGIANIMLIDGVIRMDLVNVTKIEDQQASARPVAAVAMSMQGMLRTHDQLGKAIEKMVADGILTKNQPSEPVNGK